jgi:hypothetical protein
MTDAEFLAELTACRLPSSAFNHEAHVRMGYLCLRQQGFPEALSTVRALIQNYANSIGKGSLYDEAITVGFLTLIQEHINSRGETGDWQTFMERNPELLHKDALRR